jgi:hypothetical protein
MAAQPGRIGRVVKKRLTMFVYARSRIRKARNLTLRLLNDLLNETGATCA